VIEEQSEAQPVVRKKSIRSVDPENPSSLKSLTFARLAGILNRHTFPALDTSPG
jgi:hypothetical protein